MASPDFLMYLLGALTCRSDTKKNRPLISVPDERIMLPSHLVFEKPLRKKARESDMIEEYKKPN